MVSCFFLVPKAKDSTELLLGSREPGTDQGFVGCGFADEGSPRFHYNCKKMKTLQFTCNLEGPPFYLGDDHRELRGQKHR